MTVPLAILCCVHGKGLLAGDGFCFAVELEKSVVARRIEVFFCKDFGSGKMERKLRFIRVSHQLP